MVEQRQSDEELTREEEQQLAQALKLGLVIIHESGQTGDKIAQMVLGSEEVSKGIGESLATVILAIDKQMAYSDDIKLLLAMELLMELTTLAVEAGALSEDEINDTFIDRTVSYAYTTYISTKEAMGELDLDELKRSVAQAEQEGREIGLLPDSSAQPKPDNEATGLMRRLSQGGSNVAT